MSYQIGQVAELVWTIADTATVELTVTDPDGNAATVSTTASGAAPAVSYTAEVALDQAGTWLYAFVATGNVTDAKDGQLYVQAAATAGVYTTLPELKVAMSLKVTDTEDDDDLQDAILAASRAVEGDCRRVFYQQADTRTFTPQGWWDLRLGEFNDLVSLTSLKTDLDADGTFETTWTSSDYQLLYDGGSANANSWPEPRPYSRVRAVGSQTFPLNLWVPGQRTNLVQVVGTWGWPAVPDRIRRAARMMAAEIFKLRDAPLGVTGIQDLGIIRVRDNPKYQRLIRDYQHHTATIVIA